jgi:hypothetical protein
VDLVRHLFNCRVEVLRLSGDMAYGTPTLSWSKITDIVDTVLGAPGEMMGRLDLTFQRPGKDVPMPVVAGRAPDRIGLWICSVTDQLKAGDRLRIISGPTTGTFELRAIPDPASGYTAAHHMETQVIEVAQALAGRFPSAQPVGTP